MTRIAVVGGAGGVTRVLASLPLAGVCIAEGIPAVLGGPLTDGVALVLGAALPPASGAGVRESALGAALVPPSWRLRSPAGWRR